MRVAFEQVLASIEAGLQELRDEVSGGMVDQEALSAQYGRTMLKLHDGARELARATEEGAGLQEQVAQAAQRVASLKTRTHLAVDSMAALASCANSATPARSLVRECTHGNTDVQRVQETCIWRLRRCSCSWRERAASSALQRQRCSATRRSSMALR